MIKFCGEHPVLLGFTILFTVGMVGAHWQASLLVLGALLVAWGFGAWVTRVDRDHARKIAEIKRLEADADFEMRLWTTGHPTGTFGRYPPYK